MLVPVAVLEELKQTDTQTDKIALYILDQRRFKNKIEFQFKQILACDSLT